MTEAKSDNCSGEGGKAEASMFCAEEELMDSDIDGGATRAFPGVPRFEVTIAGWIEGRRWRKKSKKSNADLIGGLSGVWCIGRIEVRRSPLPLIEDFKGGGGGSVERLLNFLSQEQTTSFFFMPENLEILVHCVKKMCALDYCLQANSSSLQSEIMM